MQAEQFYIRFEKYYGLKLSRADRQLIIRMLDEFRNPINQHHIKKVPSTEAYKTIGIILETIENYFGIPQDVFKAKSRKGEYVKCRAIGHYFAIKKIKNMSLSEIGSLIGGKDHATVLHSFKTVCNEIETNALYRKEIKIIKTKIDETKD